MIRIPFLRFLGVFIMLVLLTSCRQAPESTTPPSAHASREAYPDRYGELFEAVQLSGVFADSKTFVDCTPKFADTYILSEYAARKDSADFDLEAFVEEMFELPTLYASNFEADTSRSVREHINVLWPVLTRKPDPYTPGSLIALPEPYIVPGGRFGEIYYWDSYFTMLGLQAAGRDTMIRNMVDNFAYLIDQVGHIPNGNRTYFLSRSQPPFFALMVGLLAESDSSVLLDYLPALREEYTFWIEGQNDGSRATGPRVVRLANGDRLNRYWDGNARPRPESYREDVELQARSGRDAEELYRNLRAACESGWDFSSRWLSDPDDLATIRTTELAPVDLNALLYVLESTTADALYVKGDSAQAKRFEQEANYRAEIIRERLFDPKTGFFYDFDLEADTLSPRKTLAAAYPLFVGIATQAQADAVARVIERDFLKPGGLVTTLFENGQQWDRPNGWAPLQWVTMAGLRRYGHDRLANEIRNRWVALNTRVYESTGKLVEKYNVMDMSLEAGGGEYPVQDGFGWTNGVLLRLLSEQSSR